MEKMMDSCNSTASILSSPSISSSSSSKKCLLSAADCKQTSPACIFPKPPWLLSTLYDLEGRMKRLSLIRNINKEKDSEEEDKDEINILNEEEEASENTFAERAEIYYLKRPQLLNLLQDLYNNYLSLSDRYCQTITKLQKPSPPLPHPSFSPPDSSIDMIITKLVIAMMENDFMVHELKLTEMKLGESLRKTELQTSLLEVLESERQILLSENSKLCAMAHQRRIDQFDVDKDHRMYMLSNRIEDLEEQIRFLQGQLTHGDRRLMVMINRNGDLGFEKMSNVIGCFDDSEETSSVSCSSSSNVGMINGGKKKVMMKKSRKMMRVKKKMEIGTWWDRFKNMDLLLCGIHNDSKY